MQRVVVKTAVKTVLILLGIVVGAFAVFNIAFPQYMASAMESIGSYDMAVKYANLRYVYTGDSYDLARCFDDSVLADDNASIVEYGEKLIASEEYPDICLKRDAQFGGHFSYESSVNSSLAAAYFYTGQVDKAIEFALEDNGTASFAYGNTLMVLAYKIRNSGDAVAAAKMLVVLEEVTAEDDEQENYLKEVKATLKGVANAS